MATKKPSLPLYELVINDEDVTTGMDYISTVEKPAIQSDFIFFSEQQKENFQFRIKSKEEMTLMGAVAIPGLKIYRRSASRGEYEVFFSRDTIKQMLIRFLANGNAKNINLEHGTQIPNLIAYEYWLVADNPKQDKSYYYGFKNLSPGTLMISVDCSKNPEYWNEVVKTGIVRGFSLEGFYNMLEEKFCSEPEQNNEHITIDLLKETAIKSAILMAERKEQFAKGVTGYRWELWKTADDEACPVCLSLADLGWQPGGVLPRIGAGHPKGWKASNASCRCWKETTPESNLAFKRNKFVPIDGSKVKSTGKNAQ